jgi:three-Cys-motif partner protein
MTRMSPNELLDMTNDHVDNPDDLDIVGPWSQVKLEILRLYLKPYVTILTKRGFRPIYIDAFAGAGRHLTKGTGHVIDGSPKLAIDARPPFAELHFVDIDDHRTQQLEELSARDPRVKIRRGDCNEFLVREVFPRARREDYRRALCLLDPYRLDLDWNLVQTAGQMKSIELFLNFPIMHINRNVLRTDRSTVIPSEEARMTRFWGDESWKVAAYSQEQQSLFGGSVVEKRPGNEPIVKAFRDRLATVAGFANVPPPMPMRVNLTKGAIVYYLFFASPNPTGARIVTDVFSRYR